VIDVNTLPDFLIFAPIIARWMGAKLVLDMHEIAPEFYMSKYRCTSGSCAVRLLKYLERISMGFADRVITINEPIENLLVSRGLPRWKSTVVMNAADEARFAGCTNSSDRQGAADHTRFVMMYHGTLTRIYGLDIAVQAFALAHREMPGAELWILGSGPEKDRLGALARAAGIETKVRLTGQVDSSEIPNWLAQCDAGILPIHQDIFLDFAFPNKLPEFIVMGKAVLISRLKTIRHYFSDEALAYFDPGSPADLAQQMIRIYGDRRLRLRLSQTAKSEYASIRWELMRKRYIDLIDQLAGAPGRLLEGRSPSHPPTVAALDVFPQQPGTLPYE
jgi:glycosyltransferase involved in cell wall biosynthesis